jgi:hypothetical protein
MTGNKRTDYAGMISGKEKMWVLTVILTTVKLNWDMSCGKSTISFTTCRLFTNSKWIKYRKIIYSFGFGREQKKYSLNTGLHCIYFDNIRNHRKNKRKIANKNHDYKKTEISGFFFLWFRS